MAEQIDILQKEVDKMREVAHTHAGLLTALRVSVQMLEDKKTCDSHGGFVGKLEQICINTEVIKTNIENIDKRINGSIQDMEKHIEESKPYREMTIKHDEALKGMNGLKTLTITTLITVILAVIGGGWGFVASWGSSQKQISINTLRLDKIESLIYTVNTGKKK
jgi:hypothetical protein